MGKELIFQTLRHEQTNEIPWVPFAGVHVGKLKGYTAEEVLRDEDKLVKFLLRLTNYILLTECRSSLTFRLKQRSWAAI